MFLCWLDLGDGIYCATLYICGINWCALFCPIASDPLQLLIRQRVRITTQTAHCLLEGSSARTFYSYASYAEAVSGAIARFIPCSRHRLGTFTSKQLHQHHFHQKSICVMFSRVCNNWTYHCCPERIHQGYLERNSVRTWCKTLVLTRKWLVFW